jgi:hypothetical protein
MTKGTILPRGCDLSGIWEFVTGRLFGKRFLGLFPDAPSGKSTQGIFRATTRCLRGA